MPGSVPGTHLMRRRWLWGFIKASLIVLASGWLIGQFCKCLSETPVQPSSQSPSPYSSFSYWGTPPLNQIYLTISEFKHFSQGLLQDIQEDIRLDSVDCDHGDLPTTSPLTRLHAHPKTDQLGGSLFRAPFHCSHHSHAPSRAGSILGSAQWVSEWFFPHFSSSFSFLFSLIFLRFCQMMPDMLQDKNKDKEKDREGEIGSNLVI